MARDERGTARSNFYVVWNNMKHALSPELAKGKPVRTSRAAGGVCRVDDDSSHGPRRLRARPEARRAEAAATGRRDARARPRRLADLYLGDLLPGDLYDDWFATLRERCRQEFSDAMLRGGELLRGRRRREPPRLRSLRAALAHDPWREDLYQAALRLQIAAGQRSAAIETYMTCMRKLAEDLGIDPSAETRRLYEQVLAMEESGGVRIRDRRCSRELGRHR